MDHLGCLHYTILVGVEIVLAYAFSAFSNMENTKRNKKMYLFLALGILATMTMFRDSSVGNDTLNYMRLFRDVSNADLFVYIRNSINEPGFLGYIWLLSRISKNPYILFAVSGAIVYISIGHFIYKHVASPGIVCISLVTLMRFDFLLSAQRQALAISILLWAYDYLVEKKTIKFLLLAFIAATFHYSSLVFIVTYFLAHSKLVNITEINARFFLKWAVSVGALMILFPSLLNMALRLFPKYQYYLGSAVFDGEPRLSIFLQILVAIIMFGTSMLFTDYDSKLKFENQLFSFFSIINISLLLIASNATVLTRLCSIYTFFPVAQYSVALNSERAHYKHNQIILRLLTLALFFLYGLVIVAYRTPEWYTTYPFKFR